MCEKKKKKKHNFNFKLNNEIFIFKGLTKNLILGIPNLKYKHIIQKNS
jgi:hypothetical protein